MINLLTSKPNKNPRSTGVKNEDELFAIDILEQFKANFKNFNYEVLFSESLNNNVPKRFLTTDIPGLVFENSHFIYVVTL